MIKHGLIVADQSISSIKEQTKKVYEIPLRQILI